MSRRIQRQRTKYVGDPRDAAVEALAEVLASSSPKCNCGYVASYDAGHMLDCASRQNPSAAALAEVLIELLEARGC
jgi:hypothetical protein